MSSDIERASGGPLHGVYHSPRPSTSSNAATCSSPSPATRNRCASEVPTMTPARVSARQLPRRPSRVPTWNHQSTPAVCQTSPRSSTAQSSAPSGASAATSRPACCTVPGRPPSSELCSPSFVPTRIRGIAVMLSDPGLLGRQGAWVDEPSITIAVGRLEVGGDIGVGEAFPDSTGCDQVLRSDKPRLRGRHNEAAMGSRTPFAAASSSTPVAPNSPRCWPCRRPGATGTGRCRPVPGHGAPTLVDDPLLTSQLARWAADLPKPRSILIVSAHWESAPLTLGATEKDTPLTYDFYG